MLNYVQAIGIKEERITKSQKEKYKIVKKADAGDEI